MTWLQSFPAFSDPYITPQSTFEKDSSECQKAIPVLAVLTALVSLVVVVVLSVLAVLAVLTV